MTTAPTAETKERNPANDEQLTTAEVAAITRAPTSSARYSRHISTGTRSFRVGRRFVYRRTSVAVHDGRLSRNPPATIWPPRALSPAGLLGPTRRNSIVNCTPV
jgi:hypothetical protein